MSFGADADWYLKNLDRIATFQRYLSLVERDVLPRQIRNVIIEAAEEAVKELSAEKERLRFGRNPNNDLCWWYLSGSYDEKHETGVFIEAGASTDIEWLKAGEDAGNYPYVGLYTCGGRGPKGRAISKRYGESVGAKLPKSLVRSIPARPNDIHYPVAEQSLARIFMGSLKAAPPKNPKDDLVAALRQFTIAMLPGLLSFPLKA